MRSARTVPLLLAVAAGLHLAAMPAHLREGLAVGGFFLVVAVTQLAAAVLVHRGAGRVVRAVIAAGNLGLVALWAVSRTLGLAVAGHGAAPEPVALLDALSVVAELVAVVGLLLAGAAARPARTPRLAGVPALAMVALLAGGAGLPFAPAGHSHADDATPARAMPVHHHDH